MNLKTKWNLNRFYLTDIEHMGGTFKELVPTRFWPMSTDVLGVISLEDQSYRVEVKLFHTGNGKFLKILGDIDHAALLTKHKEHLQDKIYASRVRTRTYLCFLAALGKLYFFGISLFFLLRMDLSRMCFFLALFVACLIFSGVARRL